MMFQTTGSYFQDRLAEPGGLNEYVTEFLSLAFIHPYGASVVIALLLGLISGCFFLKACGVRASMLAAILPSFLIWIYPLESIALLTMLAFKRCRFLRICILQSRLIGFVISLASCFWGALIFLRHPLIYYWPY